MNKAGWRRRFLLDRSSADVFPWRDVEGRQLRDIIDGAKVVSRVFGIIGRYRRVNITARTPPMGKTYSDAIFAGLVVFVPGRSTFV